MSGRSRNTDQRLSDLGIALFSQANWNEENSEQGRAIDRTEEHIETTSLKYLEGTNHRYRSVSGPGVCGFIVRENINS